jgi:GGDEF domain-containing protein
VEVQVLSSAPSLPNRLSHKSFIPNLSIITGSGRKFLSVHEPAMLGANDGLYDWNLHNTEIYYSPRRKSMLGYEDYERPNNFSTWEELIDLPIRFLAMDRLAQLLKETARTTSKVAILFLDLDGSKRVNDTLGHDTGDRLPVQAAKRLRSAVRDNLLTKPTSPMPS